MTYIANALEKWARLNRNTRIRSTSVCDYSPETRTNNVIVKFTNIWFYAPTNQKGKCTTRVRCFCKLQTNTVQLEFCALGIAMKHPDDPNKEGFGRVLALKRAKKIAYQFAEKFLDKYEKLLESEMCLSAQGRIVCRIRKTGAAAGILDAIQNEYRKD